MLGFEPKTSSLPRKRSTPELHRRKVLFTSLDVQEASATAEKLERETRFELATFSLEG